MTDCRSELAALRKAARESEASLQLAQRELSKAREQVDTLTEVGGSAAFRTRTPCWPLRDVGVLIV